MQNVHKLKKWLTDNNYSKIRLRVAACFTLIFIYPFLCFLYYKFGFSLWVLNSFVCSLIVASFIFNSSQTYKINLNNTLKDSIIGFLIAAAHAPLYLFLLYDIPFQVGSDEYILISFCRKLLDSGNPDLFGLINEYFYTPAGSYIINAFIAKQIGYVNSETLRRVSGFIGLCIIFCAYIFFRVFYSRKSAIFATILLGSSHALIGISRTVMRENHCLLVELIGLTFLVLGLRQTNFKKLYFGGAILGIMMYTHYSGRIVPLAWLFFLFVYCIRKYDVKCFFRRYSQLAAPTLIGFLLTAAPMLIALSKAPADPNNYAKEQLLIYPQGRAFLCEWEKTNDFAVAFRQNLTKGLTTFNNNLADSTIIYWHPGNGFVDPLSGVLMWIGLIVLLKRRKNEVHLLTISGFIFIWLFISLFTTKNPSFHRLLNLLPFVIILTYEGIKTIAVLLTRILIGRKQLYYYKYRFAFTIVLVIVLGNIYLYSDYVRTGLRWRETYGATMRYLESRKYDVYTHYYLVADEKYPFHYFGGVHSWLDGIRLFAGWEQKADHLPPERLLSDYEPLNLKKPFVLLISNDLWKLSKNKVLQQYPNPGVYYLDGQRKQLAIEVLESQ